MKQGLLKRSAKKGVSLVEAIIAVGVLAVAIPLVFGTLAGSGDSSVSAQAETRCSWMIPSCMEELELAMHGRSQHLSRLTPAADFPASGDVLALSFNGEGAIVGKVDAVGYESGVREVGGKAVRYIISMRGEMINDHDGEPQCLAVTFTVEYPAAAPSVKRRKIDFHSRLP